MVPFQTRPTAIRAEYLDRDGKKQMLEAKLATLNAEDRAAADAKGTLRAILRVHRAA